MLLRHTNFSPTSSTKIPQLILSRYRRWQPHHTMMGHDEMQIWTSGFLDQWILDRATSGVEGSRQLDFSTISPCFFEQFAPSYLRPGVVDKKMIKPSSGFGTAASKDSSSVSSFPFFYLILSIPCRDTVRERTRRLTNKPRLFYTANKRIGRSALSCLCLRSVREESDSCLSNNVEFRWNARPSRRRRG